ncbi:MAG: ATP-binding protein [Planctomycetia bacterium]|nr:ATP-binding protein [Planctomycetia bacterium]
MASRRLIWRLFPSYLGITLVSLLAVTVYASYLLGEFAHADVQRQLVSLSNLAAAQLPKRLTAEETPQVQAICRQISDATGVRLTVVLPSGEVYCDTAEDPSKMENHGQRPEVSAALRGYPLSVTRASPTFHEPMSYYAAPLKADGKTIGAVRSGITTAAASALRRQLQWRAAIVALVILGLASGLCFYVARSISRPLDAIRAGAEQFAQGDLAYTFPETETWEMDRLSHSLRSMAELLEERLRALETTNSEHDAILASMSEGVLAVGTDRKVFSLNAAAAKLLGSERSRIQGRSLHEVVRHPLLRGFMERVLQSRAPIEEDLELGANAHDFVLQARGAILRDAKGNLQGAVIVLKDVSRMRQLETMRTDFAANVSHELKTPITSIKGFVETLLDGAMANPDDCQRFLQIVAKQSDRLNAIIDDLMSLARIEESAASAEITLESSFVKPVLEAVAEECQAKASEREVTLEVRCAADTRAMINAALLEQAIANLVDNAIKYSGPGSLVSISGERSDREVTIAVRDPGCGIPAEHQPRLFERFYRVDKARSRKLGGTGLGLAIVKHIVYAHRGRITVNSAPGEGSTFTIHLPLPVQRSTVDSSAA